ncbi:MAG: hypothetical protein ACOC58_05485, partial [Chloroflexota bacterium]
GECEGGEREEPALEPKAAPGAGVYETCLRGIRAANNPNDALKAVGALFHQCTGRSPPYSRLAKLAKGAGDHGELARLIWDATGKRPAGDVLNYVQGMLRRESKGQDGKPILRDEGRYKQYGDGEQDTTS